MVASIAALFLLADFLKLMDHWNRTLPLVLNIYNTETKQFLTQTEI